MALVDTKAAHRRRTPGRWRDEADRSKSARSWSAASVRRFGIFIATLLACLSPSLAQSDNYFRHTFFENSQMPRSYYYSHVQIVPPSRFDVVDNKIPVEEKRFVSPPNGLRLKWTSAVGGEWQARVNVPERYGRSFDFVGDTLSMWIYSEDELTNENCPWIYLIGGNVGTPTIRLLGREEKIPARQWIHLNRRFSDFVWMVGNTHDMKIDPARLSSITFVQGLDDGKEHTVYIDDIRVIDSKAPKGDAPAAPGGLATRGFERHVDISWRAPNQTNLHAFKIYRSMEGQNFEQIAVVRAGIWRFQDFIGSPGKRASYKISAVSLTGEESPLSEAVDAATRNCSDDELLTMVQEAHFRYYWDGAHPNAGMALEIIPGDQDLVAIGASGFGIMTIPVAVERKFVTREQATERMLKIVRFLKGADRFHGVFPHFLNGWTGKINPFFGKYDNGGDLVETSFLMQGLLVARQYFTAENEAEREIRETITKLWREVEWDWYRKTPDSEVLYWHWSPDYAWHISHPLIGWNETMIVYLLAIASPTHAVPASLYHTGWAAQSDMAVRYRQNWSRTTAGDHFVNGQSFYGHKLEVGVGSGSDLFFTQFSFFAFDPRNKRDAYANYFENNRKIALINRAYCMENPRKRVGYGADCWGITAGIKGGGKPVPRDENGTITVHGALGSFPYTPKESLAALKHFYRHHGKQLWGNYGFYDGFNETENWFEEVYMGLNQAPTVIMIENYRTGLVWKLFMSNPEIAPTLAKVGFKVER